MRVLLILMLAFGFNAAAQDRPAAKAGKMGKIAPKGAMGKRGKALPPKALERFEKMSPEERERALRRLPPERRRQIEQRLKGLQKMDPDQRQRALGRLEEFRALPEGRQIALRQEIRRLRMMSEPDRRARLSSEAFRSKFDDNERRLIEEVLTPPMEF